MIGICNIRLEQNHKFLAWAAMFAHICACIKHHALVLMLLILATNCPAQTTVQKTALGYELIRNGKPYYVKGVGGQVNFDKMVEIGANSFRTWGVDSAIVILDEAHKRGLTVMLGMWLQHERHGFDYDNADKVQHQLAYFKTIVDQFKNHPALLLWGIGNELDLNYTNPKCWNAVQDIAAYIHRVDPYHPTSTVTAGLDSLEVQHIKQRCPDVDIYCVNTYGDIGNVPNSIERYGWPGPYMITEWGPNGHWESPTTTWGVALEQSSTEKRIVYTERYKNYIDPYSNKCLGSYAFLWGAKQEYTETWYGIFSKENIPTEPIDALELSFTGKLAGVAAPSISEVTIGGKLATENVTLKADEKYKASANVTLPTNSGQVQYRWRIIEESTDKKSGGDLEAEAMEISGLVSRKSKGAQVDFRAPRIPGHYRLFFSALSNGKIAYSNVPFNVVARGDQDPQVRVVQWKFTDLSHFDR
jgi:hypothetical protein